MDVGIIVGVYIVINIFMGNVIEFRLMGKGLGFFILVVFFLLVFWGWFFGIIGMLFFVFFIMMLKMVLDV